MHDLLTKNVKPKILFFSSLFISTIGSVVRKSTKGEKSAHTQPEVTCQTFDLCTHKMDLMCAMQSIGKEGEGLLYVEGVKKLNVTCQSSGHNASCERRGWRAYLRRGFRGGQNARHLSVVIVVRNYLSARKDGG